MLASMPSYRVVGLVVLVGAVALFFTLSPSSWPSSSPSPSPSSGGKDFCSPCPTCSACSGSCPQCQWCPACPECASPSPCQGRAAFAPAHVNDFAPYLHNLNTFRAMYDLLRILHGRALCLGVEAWCSSCFGSGSSEGGRGRGREGRGGTRERGREREGGRLSVLLGRI